MMNLNKSLLSICFVIVFSISSRGQDLDYSLVFGKDWEKAEEFVASNETWIRAVLRREKIDYHTAVAIIYPELIRYSALRDKMEVTLLKALYVSLGADYANFSVGNFQIKPAFAELVSESFSKGQGRRSGLKVPLRNHFENDHEYRAAVVKSLEDPHTAINYVILFIRLCKDRFDTENMSDTERITFLSTAYNFGFSESREAIEAMTDKKFFSAKLVATEFYSYSDISLFWYSKNK